MTIRMWMYLCLSLTGMGLSVELMRDRNILAIAAIIFTVANIVGLEMASRDN